MARRGHASTRVPPVPRMSSRADRLHLRRGSIVWARDPWPIWVWWRNGAGGTVASPLKGESMPEFMDVHTSMKGVTSEALLAAHNADLAIQGDEGVNFKHAWADPESGMVFCLSEGPSAEAVRRIHERAGHPADQVYEVPVQA